MERLLKWTNFEIALKNWLSNNVLHVSSVFSISAHIEISRLNILENSVAKCISSGKRFIEGLMVKPLTGTFPSRN